MVETNLTLPQPTESLGYSSDYIENIKWIVIKYVIVFVQFFETMRAEKIDMIILTRIPGTES